MKVDIAIIGAGIAGASLAAELAPHASVALIEQEAVPGYHSTGRSAAFWHETLGGPAIQPLTRASWDDFKRLGGLHPRAALTVATADTVPQLNALAAQFQGIVAFDQLDGDGVRTQVPRASAALVAGLLEHRGADIDVGRVHADALTRAKRGGAVLLTDAPVTVLSPGWTLRAGATELRAAIVVNAAGAWADTVAALAGARPLGIEPRRRTIVQVRTTTADVPLALPLVMDAGSAYYFRREGPDRLWLCPHDETPVVPHDVAPEEIDIAHAIARFEAATDWRVAAVERSWAGLRSFAPDRLPVYGFDARVPGLFWCAGQGGIGIQTAPAAARLAAALILGAHPTHDSAPFAATRFA